MRRFLRRLWACVVVGWDTARIHWRQQTTFDEIIELGRSVTDGEEDGDSEGTPPGGGR